MKNCIILFFFITTSCFSQKIINVVEPYVLIDTDKNIGNINDELVVQRVDESNNIKDIGIIKIIKFSQSKTAAKILHEFKGYNIEIGDYLQGNL